MKVQLMNMNWTTLMTIYDRHSPVPASSNTTASATVTTASDSTSCDVCRNAPRDKVALLPCGHVTFCQQCIDTVVANSYHCPICRGAISYTVRFFSTKQQTVFPGTCVFRICKFVLAFSILAFSTSANSYLSF